MKAKAYKLKKSGCISASEIFYFYMQSQRKLKKISKNPFYRRSKERLAVVKWVRLGWTSFSFNPQTREQKKANAMGYQFFAWAKDFFFKEGDEICVSITRYIYETEQKLTIFIYTPIYKKKDTTFYVYEDESSRIQVEDIHEVMEDTPGLIYQLRQNKKIEILEDKENHIKFKRQPTNKGRIKAFHLRWDGYYQAPATQ